MIIAAGATSLQTTGKRQGTLSPTGAAGVIAAAAMAVAAIGGSSFSPVIGATSASDSCKFVTHLKQSAHDSRLRSSKAEAKKE